MIRASVVIRELQYERSLRGLFPLLYSKYRHMESGNFIIRLLQKLGDSAQPLLLELLEGLPQQRRNELLCALLQSFELTQALNRALSRDRPWVQVGGVSAGPEADGVRLTFSGVAVDYGALLQNPAVREKLAKAVPGPLGRVFGGPAARAAFSGAGEKTVLAILEKPKAQEALLRFAGGVLERNGVYLKLEDLRVEPDSQPDAALPAGGTRLSPELEEALLDSAAAYLRKRASLS